MKALIIGGTSGFGREVLSQFLDRDYDIITISRSASNYTNYQHYTCDVGNIKDLRNVLRKIISQNSSLDALVCIAGFARAKPSAKLTPSDWEETLTKNLIYVGVAFQELKDLLNRSSSPRVLTIGSQWSYKTGSDELVPYSIAKQALRTLTRDFAEREPKIKANHYCVPTMDTPGYWEVRKTFKKIAKERTITNFTPKGLAQPKIIAKSLIDKFLKTKASGSTFIISKDGKIRKLWCQSFPALKFMPSLLAPFSRTTPCGLSLRSGTPNRRGCLIIQKQLT
ncbi:MAG: SDR family oxidoreductase [Candidatus Pacearchaeota archaeon]|nr:SDR family oxidoreductase [Candidatus Pacearchaeota archaeon]